MNNPKMSQQRKRIKTGTSGISTNAASHLAIEAVHNTAYESLCRC